MRVFCHGPCRHTQDDAAGVAAGLEAVASVLQAMQATLGRMGERHTSQSGHTHMRLPYTYPTRTCQTHAYTHARVKHTRAGEGCDPYIYYQRVRKPMSGWRNNPDLPQASRESARSEGREGLGEAAGDRQSL